MAADEVAAHGQRKCTVDVSPGEVDAGAELTLTVWVACPFGDDLTGQSVSIDRPASRRGWRSANLERNEAGARVRQSQSRRQR